MLRSCMATRWSSVRRDVVTSNREQRVMGIRRTTFFNRYSDYMRVAMLMQVMFVLGLCEGVSGGTDYYEEQDGGKHRLHVTTKE